MDRSKIGNNALRIARSLAKLEIWVGEARGSNFTFVVTYSLVATFTFESIAKSMSLSKRESSIDHTQFICRLVKELPSGKVTCGSGCLVLYSQGASEPSAYLITTSQAVTTTHPLEHSSITVEFHDGLTFKLELESRETSGSPNLVPGRVLKDKEDKEGQVSFLSIPASRFDSRMWFKRKLKPLEKRAIQCCHSSDETLETSLSHKHISCHVISDDRRDGRFYITEPSYISFDKDTSEFALHSITDGDYATPFKSIDDFPRDQKLKGAPLLNAERKFVGMLAVASSGEHKVYPVFLPTLTSNSKDDSLGNGKTNNTIEMPLESTTLKPQSGEEDKNYDYSAKPLPPQQCGGEDKEIKTITSERQGSVSPPLGPFDEQSSEASGRNGSAEGQNQDHRQDKPQVFLPSDYGKRNSSEESMHNGSDKDENQNQQQNNHNSLLPANNAHVKLPKANVRNGNAEDRNQDQQQGEPQGLAEPESGSESSTEENVCKGSAEDESQDQQKDYSNNLPQPDNGCESSVQKNRGGNLEPKEDSGATFAEGDHPVDNSHRLLKQDIADSDFSLYEEYCSQRGNTEEMHFKNKILIPTSCEEDESNAKTAPPKQCGSEYHGAKSITSERQGSVSTSLSPCSSEDCVRNGSAEEQNQDHLQVELKILLPPANNARQLSRASARNDSSEENNHNQKQGDFQSLPEPDSVHENSSEESVRNSSVEESKDQMQGSLHSCSLPSNSKWLEASLNHGSAGEVNQDQHQTNPYKLPQPDDGKVGSFQKNLYNDHEQETKSSETLGEGDQLEKNFPSLLNQDNANSDKSLCEEFIGDPSNFSEPGKSSNFEEHSSLPPDDQDKPEDHPYNLFQPSSTNLSSLQDKSDGSFTSEVSCQDDLNVLNCLDSWSNKDYDDSEGSLQQIRDSLISCFDCDNQGDSKGYAADSESSLPGYDETHQLPQPEISNKPERDPEGSGSFSASDENDVALSGSQLRSQYATHNSFHEPQPKDEDLPFPTEVSDPTPHKSATLSGQRQGEVLIIYNPQQQNRERTAQRSNSEVPVSFPSSHTSETDMTQRTSHPSMQQKHFKAGFNEQGIVDVLPIHLFLKGNNVQRSGEFNEDVAEDQLKIQTPKRSECQEYEYHKQAGNKKQESNAGEKQQSTQNKPPINRSYSEQRATIEKPRPDRLLSEGNPIPLREGELVSQVVLNNIHVMDHLKNFLDRSVMGLKNWRYLADCNDVPVDEQLKWQLGEHYSRSEKMFEALNCTKPELPMRDLVKHLHGLNINNVASYIKDLKLKENMTFEEFFESQSQNVIGKVLMKLDLIDKEKWQNLGTQIGMESQILKQIKINCENRQENPAGHVITIISTSQSTMTIGQFKKKLENIGRKDVAGKLNKLSEKSMIGNLLDNLDLVREVTSLLNSPDSAVVKNYKDLAAECGISRERYESLQPPCADSPTQKTIEEIVQRNPKFTVEELFKNLSDMERSDVIEAISPYYKEEDVLALKRKLRITDE